MLQDTMIYP